MVVMCGIISRISYVEILAIFSTIIIMTFEPANAVVGYECGRDIKIFKEISLLDIDQCEIEEDDVETSYPKIALLNLNDNKNTDIIQCKVEIHCEMSSHNAVVKGGFSEYTYPITREMCETAHNSGTMKIGGITIDGLSVKTETRKPITLAGAVFSTGSCTGEPYTDAKIFAKITLTTQSVETKVDSDKIILPSGYQCKLSDENCIDSAGGYTFWHTKTYSALFKGKATKFESEKETVYSVNVKETTFALSIVGSEKTCGVTILKTEHPKLFIVNYEDFDHLFRKGIAGITPDYNSEIFRYLDNKFIFVERTITSQIKSLYGNFMKYKCRREREILKNALSFAATQPDLFAYRYMQSPGYMAVMTAEAVHIVQCLPVFVKIRHSNKCYNRLPIEKGNQSLFLTPLTHIITKFATEIPCDTPLREHYKIEGTWYRMMPRPISVPSPVVLLNQVGLEKNYNQQNEKIKERIMLPMEKTVIQEIISQQSFNDMDGSTSIQGVIDNNMLEELAENFWSRTWGKFTGFGAISAGLMGIFVIVSTIITIINIFIHGYALFSVYGWSILILGALWDSLARIMLFRGNHGGNRIKSQSADLETTTS